MFKQQASKRGDEINIDLEFFLFSFFFGSRKAGSKRVRKLAACVYSINVLTMCNIIEQYNLIIEERINEL